MKIKAIMLGLAVSGLLSLAIADESVIEKQEKIDQMNINPLNPDLLKGLAKELIRVDDNLKENNRITHSNYGDIAMLIEKVDGLKRQVKNLQQEVSKLKQAKK
ncbi:hypothetical protein E5P56_07430 [Helicobacter pylori]|uniref:hypothetical protein n=1 Tax=Helicobacter pylori TaxID=210 RepID=UPI000D37D4C5|nr:hypothetical protein [Helicobacter pylori]PUB95940.1 hypothetical protein C2S49_00435 [Helicobacter pylori]WQV70118.1 hypothetical protein KVK71_06815 [Helicobacter pylori]WQX53525.1 hypothetical protein E5P56_07430 [Helicobacter pylori]